LKFVEFIAEKIKFTLDHFDKHSYGMFVREIEFKLNQLREDKAFNFYEVADLVDKKITVNPRLSIFKVTM